MIMRFVESSVFRFGVTGTLAAVVNLGTLFILTHYFALWYLTSSVIGFVAAFFVNFYLQKHWVFRNTGEEVGRQMTAFFINSLINLALNTALLAFFVEVVHLWYVVAQVLTTGLIAVYNFFIYKRFVFVAQ